MYSIDGSFKRNVLLDFMRGRVLSIQSQGFIINDIFIIIFEYILPDSYTASGMVYLPYLIYVYKIGLYNHIYV